MSKKTPKIVIFEGPDGCGKTAISKGFVARHSEYQRVKLTNKKEHVKTVEPTTLQYSHMNEAEFLLHLARAVDLHIVFDRNYPSEICYGRALRQLSGSTDGEFWKRIDSEHAALDTKLVICVKHENKMRKDDVFSVDEVKRVAEEYRKFSTETACDVIVLDTTDEDLKHQLDMIDIFVYGY